MIFRRPPGTALHSTITQHPFEQCYCIPQGVSGFRVTDMQLPLKERLVVYLYKDIYGQVTIHIPNHKKQAVFPDLPVENDDILEGNVTYTVNDLFLSNMSHTLLDDDSFGTHTTVEPFYNDIYNHYVPSKNTKILEVNDLLPHFNTGFPEQLKPTGDRDVESVPKVDGFNIPVDVPFNLYPFEQVTTYPGGPKKEPNNLHFLDIVNKNPPDALTWITGRPTNIHVTGPKGFNEPPGDVHKLPGRILNQHTNAILGPPITDLNSILSQVIETPDHHLTNIPHIKFDRWVALQTNLLKQNNLYPKFAVDERTLRNLLLKTLRDNGLQVSSTGHLIDSQGKRIRMQNIRLIPVLLGDPVEYEKRFAAKGCLTKYELPHKEAVLVSSVNPPRILGIIPLGNALLTSSSSQTIPICSQSNLRPGTRCRHLSLMGSNENGPFNHKIVLNSLYRRNGDDMENIGVSTEVSDVGNDDSSKSGNVTDLAKDDAKPSEIKITTLEEIGRNDDGDDIGIRVLGGQSATSSGATLNNKGRSGII